MKTNYFISVQAEPLTFQRVLGAVLDIRHACLHLPKDAAGQVGPSERAVDPVADGNSRWGVLIANCSELLAMPFST